MTDSSEPLSPSPISEYQTITIQDFRNRFSRPSPSVHFSNPVGFFTTNELDYPSSLDEISVRGGIHLAVMGGVDPVLGQIAVAKPDITIIADLNDQAVTTSIEGRILPLTTSQNFHEYWKQVMNYFETVIRRKDPKRWDFPIDQDSMRGGWSSKDKFQIVRNALAAGKIKFVSADINTTGLELAKDIATKTGLPIRLIYLSNIFDYSSNDEKSFKERLRQGTETGLIDRNAQIVDSRGTTGLETHVLSISDYLSEA